jgi:hypothetical protein
MPDNGPRRERRRMIDKHWLTFHQFDDKLAIEN